jgi:hypothetical protein
MALQADVILKHSEDVVAREIEGELILVPLTSGVGDLEDELFSLNETGCEIWRRVDGKSNLGEIVTALVETYEAEAGEIERDVIGLTEELIRRRMLIEC